jgi:hypothetical protein
VVVLSTWEMVQVPPTLKAPAPLLVKWTVPPGKFLVGASESLTVAVQLLVALTATGAGTQFTAVEVVRLLTVSAKVPLLDW